MQLSLTEGEQIPTGGPIIFRAANLNLLYQPIMLEDQTLVVSAEYSVRQVSLDNGPFKAFPPEDYDSLDRETTFSLFSSGFKIAPDKETVEHEGAQLPLHLAWTITATGPGERDLLFKLGETLNSPTILRFEPKTEATLNGERIQSDGGGNFKLRVTVRNFWGVSNRVASAMVAGFALVGFISVYPLLNELLKRRYLSSGTPPKSE